MQELLEHILKELASKPEKVKVEKKEEDTGITFIINVDDEDKGKIIGKGGVNIKAIRSLLAIVAQEEGQRVYLKVE